MPEVTGVLETALYVRDLEASVRFYRDVMGFRELLREEGRLVGMQVGGAKQTLLLFAEGKSTSGSPTPGGHIPAHDGHGQLHLCFSIAPDAYEPWTAHLDAHGVGVESIVDVPSEPGRQGGKSVYFRDLDGHLIELAVPGIWPGY